MPTVAQLIARQQTEVARLDNAQLARIQPILDRARTDLATSLQGLAVRNRQDRYTYAHLNATMVQVTAAAQQAGRQLGTVLDTGAAAAQDQATRHLADQAQIALADFGQAQRLDIGTAAGFLDNNGTLLDRHAKFADKWTQATIKATKETLAVEILKKSSVDDVVKKLTAPGGIMEGQRYAARRLVVTEMSYARNKRTFEDMKATAAANPGRVLKKRLLNIIDNRTAPDTLAIIAEPDNLVRQIDEEFLDPLNGRTFLYPPNRPNDRATIAIFWDTPEEQKAVAADRSKAEKLKEQRAKENAKPARAGQGQRRADGRIAPKTQTAKPNQEKKVAPTPSQNAPDPKPPEQPAKPFSLPAAHIPASVQKDFPELVNAKNVLRVEDEGDPAVQSVLEDLRLVPRELWPELEKRGFNLYHVARKTVPELAANGYLTGQQPSGYPAGKTFADAAGIYNGQHRSVAVSALPVGHGSKSLALHELAHVVGDLMGVDDSAALIEAHKLQYPKIFKEYFKQGGPGGYRGRQEMLAEAFAWYYKMGPEATELAWGKSIVQIIEKTMKGVIANAAAN